MVELFLFRHAGAEPRTAELPDENRALTERGRERFVGCVDALERLEIDFDRIYHGPWLRAVQSAELLVPLLEGETVVTPHLAGPPTRELIDLLEGERIALVCHEPWATDLLSWLVFGERTFETGGRRDFLDFGKGAVAWLSGQHVEPGSMSLRAFLTPKTLRRLART
jgi:phosphohistidine phosphatase